MIIYSKKKFKHRTSNTKNNIRLLIIIINLCVIVLD